MTLCPCCRRPLDDDQQVDVEHLREAPLSKMQKKLLVALIDSHPRAVRTEVLIDRLWGDDPNGGPDNPPNVIRTMVTNMRKRLPDYGWTIPLSFGGPGSYGSYRLEPVKVP